MAKITESSDGKKGDFFKLNDIVGIPFELTEDLNALSDFRETPVKPPKEGEEARKPYMVLNIRCNGEQKDLHLTMSALRSIRNIMAPGAATWKGVRLVCNAASSGFNPAKFTRLMGDYAMPKDQQTLGQVLPVTTPGIVDPILSPIIEKLKYGSSFFKDGLIPEDTVAQTCVTPANFQALRDKGLIYQPVQGFFTVVK